MKKLDYCVLGLAACAAAGLRVGQMLTGFDADGLPVPGNLFALLLPVLLVMSAAFFAVRARKLPALREDGEGLVLEQSFRFSGNKAALLCTVTGAFLVVASAAAALAGYSQGLRLPLLSVASAVAGLSLLYVVFALSGGKPVQGGALLLPVCVLIVYLILLYRSDASNPVLGQIYIEILAAASLTLGTLELAGFAFHCGAPRVFMPCCAMVPILLLALAAERRSFSSLLLCLGCALLALGFLLAAEMKEAPKAAEAPTE